MCIIGIMYIDLFNPYYTKCTINCTRIAVEVANPFLWSLASTSIFFHWHAKTNDENNKDGKFSSIDEKI